MLPVKRRPVPTAWNEPLEPLWQRMPCFFEDWPEFMAEGPAALRSYPVDMREDDDNVYVDAEMPGFRKEDINVELDKDVLRISAERTPEEFTGKEHLNERRYTRVQRQFALPALVKEDDVDATFSDGVLHLAMKKDSETSRRRIAIT
jgi:HSP20 family protein